MTHWIGSLDLGWSDGAHDVDVSGSYAYVAAVFNEDANAYLSILDLSDPANPVEVGATPWLGGHEGGVQVVGPRAYVTTLVGLQIVDVSSPTDPTVLGGLGTPGYALDVAVVEPYAYVGDYGSILAVDVSNPTTPVIVGSTPSQGVTENIVIAGDHAYVAAGEGGLEIVDISVPAAPVVVGTVATPGYAEAVHVFGTWAYVATGLSGLQIVEVSDPSAPVLANDVAGFARDVVVVGDHAYAPWSWVLNVSDPGNPWIEHLFYLPGRRVATDGEHLYAAGGWGSFNVAAIGSSFANPLVGVLNLSGSVDRVAVNGNLACLITESSTAPDLQIVDVSDPSAPTLLGTLETPGGEWDVQMARGYAFLSGSDGLHSVDLLDPTAPTLSGTVPLSDDPVDFRLDGHLAYVAVRYAGLRIIDISDPTAPTLISSLESEQGEVTGIAVEGARVYLADHGGGVEIIDVSVPSVPRRIGSFETSYGTFAVASSGNFALVANGLDGLRIFDVSEPAAAFEVTRVPLPDASSELTLSNGFAYVANRFAGLQIVDISDLPGARLVGGFDTTERTRDVAVFAEHAFLADWKSLIIVSAQCGTTATAAPGGRPAVSGTGHPNPFTIHTRIPFETRAAGHVRLEIRDIRGRHVWSSSREVPRGGEHFVMWTGRDGRGRPLPAGVYFYELRAGGDPQRGKVTLVR
jgi:hypothetical protein